MWLLRSLCNISLRSNKFSPVLSRTHPLSLLPLVQPHQHSPYTTMSNKFQVKWGILATGGIAETFARDLWPNPETRGVKDVEHKVVAAASSSSVERAQKFLKEVRAVDDAKAYGSYKELANDPNVCNFPMRRDTEMQKTDAATGRCHLRSDATQPSLPECPPLPRGRQECSVREGVHDQCAPIGKAHLDCKGEESVFDGGCLDEVSSRCILHPNNTSDHLPDISPSASTSATSLLPARLAPCRASSPTSA